MIWWILAGLVVAYVLVQIVAEYIVNKAENAERRAAINARTPIALDEIEAARQAMKRAELPVVTLSPRRAEALDALDTKIGGQAWAPDALHTWPLSKTGVPLCFLAQINFAQMPAIEDFPRRGLLQVFADIDPDADAIRKQHKDMSDVIGWYPEPEGQTVLTRPDGAPIVLQTALLTDKDLFAFYGDDVADLDIAEDDMKQAGWAVEADMALMQPPAFDLPAPHDDLCFNEDGPAPRPVPDKSVAQELCRLEDESVDLRWQQIVHRIGGLPIFLTERQRKIAAQAGLDRVVLQLGMRVSVKPRWYSHVTLAIAQDDLRAGNIEKARFFWSHNA